MYKYKVDAKNHTHSDGTSYRVIDGVLTVPFEINAPFARLIEEPKKEEIKRDWKAEAIEAGLEGEELKKFMGKNKALRQKQLDKLKG